MSIKRVDGVSYAGAPRDNTAMYISNKVAYLLDNLYWVQNCVVFVEKGIEIPRELENKHEFVVCDNVQGAYAEYLQDIEKDRRAAESTKKYICTEKGYYLGEKVKLGENIIIEPGCVIGHGVTIGDNTIIKAGAVIKNAVIGTNCLINENAVIGANGFTMARDENGNLIRIPSLGAIQIGNNVEIGVNDNISVGSAGNTIIEDNVKLDALVHIGHDAIVKRNVEITAGSIVGGFSVIEKNSFIGINATIKNRITIGESVVVGMGSVVIKSVDSNATVYGNPAREQKAEVIRA